MVSLQARRLHLHTTTPQYRVDTARDGRAFTKQSFLERYGEGEGLARWKAAPPADGTHVSGLGLNCASAGCGRESEAYCHDCKESFCSYACLCTWHRKKRAKNHNRITYTLSGARRLTEGSESYSPRKTIEELQPRINDLEHQKQMAVQTEDYSMILPCPFLLCFYTHTPSHRLRPASEGDD